MTGRVIAVTRALTPAEAVALVSATFSRPGRYYVEALAPMLKASTATVQDEFETWFLRELFKRSRAHFTSSRDAIWNVLDHLLEVRGVAAPSDLDYWELNRTLFDLSTASTARMVGFRLPADLTNRLQALQFTVPEMLDFPAVAYRMGLIFRQLEGRAPVDWWRLRDLAGAVPLTPAARAAVEHARLHAGIHMRPIFDEVGYLWTAERELGAVRQITSGAIERRSSTRVASRELAATQRAQGIGRDSDRVIRTEIAEARARGVWDSEIADLGGETKLYRLTSPNACKGCLRLYRTSDGMPRLYTRAEVAAGDALGLNTGNWRDWHIVVGANHPSCVCGSWTRWLAAMAPVHAERAQAIAEKMKRLKVFEEPERDAA